MDWVAGNCRATGAGAGASERLTRVGVNTGLTANAGRAHASSKGASSGGWHLGETGIREACSNSSTEGRICRGVGAAEREEAACPRSI